MFIRLLVLVVAITVPIFSLSSAGIIDEGADYSYQNCSNSADYGLPLMGCSYISVSADLSELWLRDNGEEIGKEAAADKEYFVLNSVLFPLAVPRADYEVKKDWNYGEFRYVKIGKIEPKIFPWGVMDVIVVINRTSASARILPDLLLRNPSIFKDAIITFWYSPLGGVRAIGAPASKVDSSETFYCSSPRCLFQLSK